MVFTLAPLFSPLAGIRLETTLLHKKEIPMRNAF